MDLVRRQRAGVDEDSGGGGCAEGEEPLELGLAALVAALSFRQEQVEGVDLAVADVLNDLGEAGGVTGAGRGQINHRAGAVLPEDEQIHVPDESLAGAAGP